ncbi:MAG: hypothetical protein QXP39_02535 [Candidatus Aenigmatarchaeota archaeon]
MVENNDYEESELEEIKEIITSVIFYYLYEKYYIIDVLNDINTNKEKSTYFNDIINGIKSKIEEKIEEEQLDVDFEKIKGQIEDYVLKYCEIAAEKGIDEANKLEFPLGKPGEGAGPELKKEIKNIIINVTTKEAYKKGTSTVFNDIKNNKKKSGYFKEIINIITNLIKDEIPNERFEEIKEQIEDYVLKYCEIAADPNRGINEANNLEFPLGKPGEGAGPSKPGEGESRTILCPQCLVKNARYSFILKGRKVRIRCECGYDKIWDVEDFYEWKNEVKQIIEKRNNLNKNLAKTEIDEKIKELRGKHRWWSKKKLEDEARKQIINETLADVKPSTREKILKLHRLTSLPGLPEAWHITKNIVESLTLIIIGLIISTLLGNFWFILAFLCWGISVNMPEPQNIGAVKEKMEKIRGEYQTRMEEAKTEEERADIAQQMRAEIEVEKIIGEIGLRNMVGIGILSKQFLRALGAFFLGLAFLLFGAPLAPIIGLIILFASYFLIGGYRTAQTEKKEGGIT